MVKELRIREDVENAGKEVGKPLRYFYEGGKKKVHGKEVEISPLKDAVEEIEDLLEDLVDEGILPELEDIGIGEDKRSEVEKAWEEEAKEEIEKINDKTWISKAFDGG